MLSYKITYKIKNSKYLQKQRVLHTLIFSVCLISLVSISIMYGITGIEKVYKCLNELPQCTGQCKRVLNIGWFPYIAFIPTNIFKGMDLHDLKLQQSKQFVYALCDELKFGNETRNINFDLNNINDIVNIYFQFPNTLDHELLFYFDQQQSIVVDGNIKTSVNNQLKLKLSYEDGSLLAFSSLKHIQKITFPDYYFDQCILYEDQQLSSFKYLVVEQIDGAILEPLYLNFIGAARLFQPADYILISLLVLSSIGLIETMFYVSFEIRLKKDRKKNQKDLISFIDSNLVE
ncbi:Conserved_hypothetical protein [Hexamita inflata]|uniref:Transmembrane protein n=1 Tax=Hexamita inflata TaxID=28002 RepID=A0AA86UHQ7_9EUKA|nr:Conserved hypothetical protein [Hexamita inflata]